MVIDLFLELVSEDTPDSDDSNVLLFVKLLDDSNRGSPQLKVS